MKRIIVITAIGLICCLMQGCQFDESSLTSSLGIQSVEATSDSEASLVADIPNSSELNKEKSAENFQEIANGLNDWTELFSENNIKICQSSTEPTLYKYEINLLPRSVVGYSYIHEPQIEYLSDNIIKISISNGTNSEQIQYLGVSNGEVTNISEQYSTYGYSVECLSEKSVIVAYTGTINRGDEIKIGITVCDIFSGKEKAVIVRDFYALAEVVEEMEFVNDSEICITYKSTAYGTSDDYIVVTEYIKI